MADSLNAVSKAEIDPVFNKQVKRLQSRAKDEEEARTEGDQSEWYRPELEGWDGDLFDLIGMAKAFDRKESNRMFVEAIKDPTSPGVVGDLVATTTMIDYLAIMERAFRDRHTMRRPRAVLHAMGRKFGHGNDAGTLVQTALEYVRGILQQAKAEQGGGGGGGGEQIDLANDGTAGDLA